MPGWREGGARQRRPWRCSAAFLNAVAMRVRPTLRCPQVMVTKEVAAEGGFTLKDLVPTSTCVLIEGQLAETPPGTKQKARGSRCQHGCWPRHFREHACLRPGCLLHLDACLMPGCMLHCAPCMAGWSLRSAAAWRARM